jgi:hypothetical protein
MEIARVRKSSQMGSLFFLVNRFNTSMPLFETPDVLLRCTRTSGRLASMRSVAVVFLLFLIPVVCLAQDSEEFRRCEERAKSQMAKVVKPDCPNSESTRRWRN